MQHDTRDTRSESERRQQQKPMGLVTLPFRSWVGGRVTRTADIYVHLVNSLPRYHDYCHNSPGHVLYPNIYTYHTLSIHIHFGISLKLKN